MAAKSTTNQDDAEGIPLLPRQLALPAFPLSTQPLSMPLSAIPKHRPLPQLTGSQELYNYNMNAANQRAAVMGIGADIDSVEPLGIHSNLLRNPLSLSAPSSSAAMPFIEPQKSHNKRSLPSLPDDTSNQVMVNPIFSNPPKRVRYNDYNVCSPVWFAVCISMRTQPICLCLSVVSVCDSSVLSLSLSLIFCPFIRFAVCISIFVSIRFDPER